LKRTKRGKVEGRGWRIERGGERGGKNIDKRGDKSTKWGWGGKVEEREGIKRECSIQSKRGPRRLEVIGTIQ
jgi:hypothetical protein